VTDVEGNGALHPVTEVQTVFIVAVDLDGGSRVLLDPNERFSAQRTATPKDVYPALANILADFQGMKTAEAVVSMQATLARQMADSHQAQEILRNLNRQ
jgi:hypothetical protein